MEENQRTVFDAERPITVILRTPDGAKPVRVRFPSDAEWAERQRRRKVVIKQLGRGSSETTVPDAEAVDSQFIEKIRQEPAVDLDAYEAVVVLQQLGQADVVDVEMRGNSFVVTLRVIGAETIHVLHTPSAKDVFDFRRGFARMLDLPYNRQQITINLTVGGDLYKKLMESVEGYVGDVPIIHQAAAVQAVINALDTAFEEDRQGNC